MIAQNVNGVSRWGQVFIFGLYPFPANIRLIVE